VPVQIILSEVARLVNDYIHK